MVTGCCHVGNTEPVLRMEQGGSLAGCRATPVFLTHVIPRREVFQFEASHNCAAGPHLKKTKSKLSKYTERERARERLGCSGWYLSRS